MSSLVTIACLLLIAYANGAQMFFNDDAEYNPCHVKSTIFYHRHPEDIHKYYQCDESGNAYLRSCGTLVWDEVRTTCNWPSAVAPPPRRIDRWFTIIPSPPPRTTTTTLSTTTSQLTPSEVVPTEIAPTLFSACSPISLCGEHGRCLELHAVVSLTSPNFVCICAKNWFGRLCDKNIADLTTPPPPVNLDLIKEKSFGTMNSFSLPVLTEKSENSIFYGLKYGDNAGQLNRVQYGREN